MLCVWGGRGATFHNNSCLQTQSVSVLRICVAQAVVLNPAPVPSACVTIIEQRIGYGQTGQFFVFVWNVHDVVDRSTG